jgi:hypothetical protein
MVKNKVALGIALQFVSNSTATFYVDGDFEGQHSIVVRLQFHRSLFLSSLLIVESGRSICPNQFGFHNAM